MTIGTWRLPFVLLLSCAFISPVLGQSQADPLVDAEAQALYSRVMSPFCPGRTLADCPSSAAQELKRDIKDRLARGETAEQIEAQLYAEYGDEVRGMPQPSGAGLVLYVAPLLVFVASSLLLIVWWRRIRPAEDATDVRTDGAAQAPELRERLDEELARMM